MDSTVSSDDFWHDLEGEYGFDVNWYIKTTVRELKNLEQKVLPNVIEEIKSMEKTDPDLVETYLASCEACKKLELPPSDGFPKVHESFED